MTETYIWIAVAWVAMGVVHALYLAREAPTDVPKTEVAFVMFWLIQDTFRGRQWRRRS